MAQCSIKGMFRAGRRPHLGLLQHGQERLGRQVVPQPRGQLLNQEAHVDALGLLVVHKSEGAGGGQKGGPSSSQHAYIFVVYHLITGKGGGHDPPGP